MNIEFDYTPADLALIEARARKLRAESLANGITGLKRLVAAPFHRRAVTRA